MNLKKNKLTEATPNLLIIDIKYKYILYYLKYN